MKYYGTWADIGSIPNQIYQFQLLKSSLYSNQDCHGRNVSELKNELAN